MKPANDLISVIIPAYNHESYVKQAIQSAIDQTYSNLELLVVDDGSADATWKSIQSMEEVCRQRFKRVEFWRQENQGICETLNMLLDKAHGEYFMRLDSDDMIKPCSVEKLHAFLKENDEYGLAVGDNEIIDDEGSVVYWTWKLHNTMDQDQAAFKTFADHLRSMRPEVDFQSDDFGRYDTFWVNYVPNGYLVRKKLMEQIKFSPQAPREDYFMMLQLAKLSKFKFFDEILHSYRWHQSNNIKKQDENIRFTNMTRKYELRLLQENGDIERFHQFFNKLMHSRRRVKFKIGDVFEIFRLLDIFDERKLYCLRLGSKSWPLFEFTRDSMAPQASWRLGKAREEKEFIF